ncbi:hypothetical protein [Nocardia sp. CNY236]|uniref:hypothetical protein n=1 Tax=Nocardia sp. CNY236 TaxID=1169152 RepID=UPI00041AE486|nr:hypothetical protein [Nocardia sp. CNY236]
MVSSEVPRTVKAVDTAQLILLDEQARKCGLNRHHGAGWLATYADRTATHYLWPVLAHQLARQPEFSPHWRCLLLLTVRDGRQVCSLLDVLPASFNNLPETLDSSTKSEIATKLEHESLMTQAEWAQSVTADMESTVRW